MKIAVIYGFMRKGSTYQCTQLLLEDLARQTETEVTEFFLPRDMPHFCTGCFGCIHKNEDKCPHYDMVHPISKAMDEADVVVLASPTYVYNMSGPLKALMDHFGYMWMPHRPRPSMFHKVGVVISTTAGGGAGVTCKAMKRNLVMWGAKRVYQFGMAVQAAGWQDVKPKMREQIAARMEKLSHRVLKAHRRIDRLWPTPVSFFWVSLVRAMVKADWWNPPDKVHWNEQGWAAGKSPWRS